MWPLILILMKFKWQCLRIQKEELSIINLKAGSSSSIRFCITWVKRKSLLFVQKTSWRTLLKGIMERSFAMDRQVQARHSQWVDRPKTTSTEVSFHDASHRCSRRLGQSLSRQSLLEFHMLKSTMSWCLIYFLLFLLMNSQEISQFKKIQMEIFEWKVFQWTSVIMKKMLLTSYLKEIPTEQSLNTN